MTDTAPAPNIHVSRFSLGERVWIVDAEIYGRVKQILVTAGCIDFQVAYFDEDKVRRTEWFDGTELRGDKRSVPSDDTEVPRGT